MVVVVEEKCPTPCKKRGNCPRKEMYRGNVLHSATECCNPRDCDFSLRQHISELQSSVCFIYVYSFMCTFVAWQQPTNFITARRICVARTMPWTSCLSVCPSVCHTPVFCSNGYTYMYPQSLFTVGYSVG